MRRFFIMFGVALTLFARPADAAAPAPVVVLSAQQIALHADRGVLIADSGVAIKVGHATPLNATRAVYDLRANTLIAVGDGAGSGFMYDFKTGTSGPVPGATVPQLGTFDALAVGRQVELHPAETIVFSNAQVLAGSTFVPVASYTYDIPPPHAKDFGYSPVPSAALEYPVYLGGSKNFYAFTRARYDRYTGGPGAGLEEHYAATDRGYITFGQTLDMDGGRLDMAAYQRFSDTLSQSLTGSYLLGAHTWRYALTRAQGGGYSQFSIFQYNNYRLDDFLESGSQHPVGHVASIRFQMDFAHDVHPGDYSGSQDFRLTPGVHVDTAALRIAAASLSASGDLGEAFYNYGRVTLASDVTFWSNIPVDPRLSLNAGATFAHQAPPFPSTYRTYTIGDTWRPSNAFNLVSSINYTHDYGQIFGQGRPEWSAAVDVTFRRRNHTGLEIGAVAPFGGVGNMNRQAGFNLRFFKW